MQCACAVLYCPVWPVCSTFFPHYLTDGNDFRENVIRHKMCVLIFSTTSVCSTLHSKENSARYFHKCTYVFMWRTRHVSDFNRDWISSKDFRKIFKHQIQWKSVLWGGPGRVVGIATGYGLDGPGIESRWGARFFAPVQTGPGAHPATCTMGTGSFPGIKSGRGVTLTPHPLLVTWSWKSRAIPLLPL